MAEEEPKPPTPEELKAAQERLQKSLDDALVKRFRHYQQLASRMIVGDVEPPAPMPLGTAERIEHMAEMLLLLDVATGTTAMRFRSRYAGNY